MSRAAACLCYIGLSTACSPLIATVGIEDHDAENAIDSATVGEVPGLDGSVVQVDASAESARDAGSRDAAPDSALSEGGDASGGPHCVLLPDLIGESARQDASVNNLDTGEIKAAFDDALACDTAPLAGTIAISYARSDGTPIVREGQTYALAWPAGPAGSATVYATPAPCLQPLLPANVLIMLPLGGCQEISTGTSQVLRFIVGGPAPSLSGITLCEGGCPDAF